MCQIFKICLLIMLEILKIVKNLRIFSANKCLNLNDTSFKELITVLPGLEKIFIESTELTGDYFDLLPEGLKELNINSCLRVSTENLHKVCRACKNLEILEIEILDIDKEFYEELGVNCTNLRSLKVFFPRSDVDVSKQIKSLSKLTKLTIFATTFELPNIADSVKNLEELHIHIRQETINMIDFSKFQQLKNVCLTFSPFRKQELMSLGKCRNLEHITIEGYYNTDQETIKKILKGCPKIKHVKCPKISIDIKFLDEI
ncbi:unnamed protein product [Meganyctiphanes norvegica]|uniref:Disease resistance R13L4/SHOC-2-like LRR domain-containing protein n=1 Tax=Meganyctiphanes norvegica TaxID=48144 RepID=A0AAV2Q9V5_MEGNR